MFKSNLDNDEKWETNGHFDAEIEKYEKLPTQRRWWKRVVYYSAVIFLIIVVIFLLCGLYMIFKTFFI